MSAGFDRSAERTSAARRAGRAWPVHLLALAAILVAPVSSADIYKKVDSNGITHLTDRPRGPGWRLIMRTRAARQRTPGRRGASPQAKLNRTRLTPLIEKIAREVKIDTALMHAVIETESNYNPDAVSRAGAMGLMQLMPGTAQRYGVRDPHDPTENLYGGARYLRDLMVQFKNLQLALAAYNAGENAVIKHGHKIPPFPETQDYVRKVLARYRATPGS
ncbi:MAG: lytic transglycosylase domain-containing protein [Gammaproteobacteria bacterium]|nr:lytic transglycosylase domain-containing protein [Gammaproteobacteria bacterium]